VPSRRGLCRGAQPAGTDAGLARGALASLRSLAPGALHEAAEPWPYSRSGESEPSNAGRFWLEDNEEWHWRDGRAPSSARAGIVRQLAGQPRISEAWDALVSTFRYGRDCDGHRICGTLAGWSSLHESPSNTRDLRAEIVEGRDLAAEWAARRAGLLASSQPGQAGARG
jgi:hypothetical protein